MQIRDSLPRLVFTRGQWNSDPGLIARMRLFGTRRLITLLALILLVVSAVFTGVGNNSVEAAELPPTYLTQWGSVGAVAGQFQSPQGVAIDSFGNIYVSEFFGDRVQKFTSNGAFITSWAGPGPVMVNSTVPPG